MRLLMERERCGFIVGFIATPRVPRRFQYKHESLCLERPGQAITNPYTGLRLAAVEAAGDQITY